MSYSISDMIKQDIDNKGDIFAKMLDPKIIENPNPVFEELRSKNSLLWMKDSRYNKNGFFIVTSYEIAKNILNSPSFGHVYKNLDSLKGRFESFYNNNPYIQTQLDWISSKNPPDHTYLRNMIISGFKMFSNKKLKSVINGIIKDLIIKIENRKEDRISFMRDFAVPLPLNVLISILGFPKDDIDKLKIWSSLLLKLFNSKGITDKDRITLNQTIRVIHRYFRNNFKQSEEYENGTLISYFLSQIDSNHDYNTIINNVIFILLAGHITTSALIGNMMKLLCKYPDQQQLLVDDTNLISNTVEESLRFEPPVQRISRSSLQSVVLENKKIESNTKFQLLLGACNRDTSFNQPNKFIITRDDIPHLSFGGGIHKCVGAYLARLEASMALNQLLEEFSFFTLSKPVKYHPNFTIRVPSSIKLNVV